VKKSKYGNKKPTRILNGEPIKFDSLKEAKRYDELYLLLKQKKITELRLQPSFKLQESFKDLNGKTHRSITYVSDFQYRQDGQVIVEDVKGFLTDIYRLKKKLFLFKYRTVDFREL